MKFKLVDKEHHIQWYVTVEHVIDLAGYRQLVLTQT